MSASPFQSPPPGPEPLLVDAPTAARMLSVSERLLWGWTKDDRIACVRIGRRVLYPVQGLRDWVATHATGGPVPTVVRDRGASIETPPHDDLKHQPVEPPVTTPEAARCRPEGAP